MKIEIPRHQHRLISLKSKKKTEPKSKSGKVVNFKDSVEIPDRLSQKTIVLINEILARESEFNTKNNSYLYKMNSGYISKMIIPVFPWGFVQSFKMPKATKNEVKVEEFNKVLRRLNKKERLEGEELAKSLNNSEDFVMEKRTFYGSSLEFWSNFKMEDIIFQRYEIIEILDKYGYLSLEKIPNSTTLQGYFSASFLISFKHENLANFLNFLEKSFKEKELNSKNFKSKVNKKKLKNEKVSISKRKGSAFIEVSGEKLFLPVNTLQNFVSCSMADCLVDEPKEWDLIYEEFTESDECGKLEERKIKDVIYKINEKVKIHFNTDDSLFKFRKHCVIRSF